MDITVKNRGYKKDMMKEQTSLEGVKTRLNIAVLGHKHIPSREGGIEVVVDELSTRMVRLGHRVTCYSRGGHHVSGAEFDVEAGKQYKGVSLKTVPTIKRRGLAAITSSFFGALSSALGNYDVVHIHAEGPAAFCWIPHLFRKKVIVTIHGLDWAREKWKGGIGSYYIHYGEKMAVKYADEIIVLSKNMQQYFKDTYGRETRFVPNGVAEPEYAAADLIKEQLGLDKDSYILYLGRIVPEKGAHYLIEAFQAVSTDKKLVIAGGVSDTDEYMEKLKQMAEGDERIVFTGFVQNKVLRELFSNSYVYVLPSDLEGMPLSLLEAMSYGNCCLVSDIPECADVIEHYGTTFKKGDVEDLKMKLQTLCDDAKTVKGYKEKASDYICYKYDWNEVVDQTLGLYRG